MILHNLNSNNFITLILPGGGLEAHFTFFNGVFYSNNTKLTPPQTSGHFLKASTFFELFQKFENTRNYILIKPYRIEQIEMPFLLNSVNKN